MKGKKTDSEFLSNFISDCLQNGKISQEEILETANLKIIELDQKIKEINNIKILRSKLLDIVHAFGNSTKIKEKYLKYCNIDIKYSSDICLLLKKEKMIKIPINNCINQMIEYNIISKKDNYLVCGDNFEDYLKFLVGEV